MHADLTHLSVCKLELPVKLIANGNFRFNLVLALDSKWNLALILNRTA